MELAIQPSPEQIARSWEAHLIRTRDRIAQFQQKLQSGVTGPGPDERPLNAGERNLMEVEIAKLEGQLVRPAEMPKTDAAPSMIAQLQGEIRALGAIVKELLAKPQASTPVA